MKTSSAAICAVATAVWTVACGNGFQSRSTDDGGGTDAATIGAGGSVAMGSGGRGSGGREQPVSGGAAGGAAQAGGAASGGASGSAGRGPTSTDAGTAVDAGGIVDAGVTDAPAGYADVVRRDGPLVYWRMGIRSGTTVPDELGGGNSLVLQGGGHQLLVKGATRDDDGAILFDGAASFAIASDSRALDFAGGAPFTLECWARRATGGTSYFQHLLSNVEGSAGDRDGYALYLLPAPAATDSAHSAFEYDRPGHDLGVFGPLGEEDRWTHYVAVFDGKKASVYVDGTFADASTADGTVSARNQPFTVGRASGGGASFFNGAIDEIAVYPRALGAADVARHHAAR